jgi:hypothetical protein
MKPLGELSVYLGITPEEKLWQNRKIIGIPQVAMPIPVS